MVKMTETIYNTFQEVEVTKEHRHCGWDMFHAPAILNLTVDLFLSWQPAWLAQWI